MSTIHPTSLASAVFLSLAACVFASTNEAEVPQPKVMELLASEGMGSVSQIVQEKDRSGKYDWWIVAHDVPREISTEACAGREVRLGVKEPSYDVPFRQVTSEVALKSCSQAKPRDFAPVFDVTDDKQLASIANSIVAFVRTKGVDGTGTMVRFQNDEAKKLSQQIDLGRLVQIERFKNGQVSALVGLDERQSRTLRLDLDYRGNQLAEIRVSRAPSVGVAQ
jgi:hypothetical protein